MDFFALDTSLRGLLSLYLPDALRQHMWPHYQRMGRLAGGHLDELATLADRHPPGRGRPAARRIRGGPPRCSQARW